MASSDSAGGPHLVPSAADPSGVHARVEPRSAEEWRQRIEAVDGEISPSVDSLLHAFATLERQAQAFALRTRAAQAMADRLTLSVHVIGASGVLFANAAARKLEREGVLIASEGRLECAGFEAKEDLEQAIADAQRGSSVRRSFVLIRDRKPRLLGLVISADHTLPGAAIVVVADPTAPRPVDAEVYCRHFGLTPAEGRVAERLAIGESAREVAEHLEIGVETVRTHVKNILRKMGTNRQIDAVRVLVTGPLLLG